MVRAVALGLLACGTLADPQRPQWPQQYMAVMKFSIPYAGVETPVRAWHDEAVGAQRVEYYQGLQLEVQTPSGDAIKYVYRNGVRTCLKNEAPHRRLAASSSLTAFLPNISQYEFAGVQDLDGVQVQRWVHSEKHGTAGTMDDHVEFFYDPLLQKPVRWHQHSRDAVFGSHTDEYVVEYLAFDMQVEASVFSDLPAECSKPESQEFSLQSAGLMAPLARRGASVDLDQAFEAFAHQHLRAYGSEEEFLRRKDLYTQNVEIVKRLNKEHKGVATFKGNQFLDMTREEVMRFRGGRRQSATRPQEHREVHQPRLAALERPKNFDWREAAPGSVAAVKDQGFCGSCWSFGLVSSIESINFLQNGHVMTLMPEQFVLDCAWSNKSNACDGGLSDDGADTILQKFGGKVPSAASYGHYLSVDGYCKDITSMPAAATLTGYKFVVARDEGAVLDALLSVGPLSIGINANVDELLFYDTGILNTAACEKVSDEDVDHQVNLVGYGTDPASGLDYYTIRNSWSTYWGDQGYFKVVRGKRDCAVSTQAGYPVLAQAVSPSIVV